MFAIRQTAFAKLFVGIYLNQYADQILKNKPRRFIVVGYANVNIYQGPTTLPNRSPTAFFSASDSELQTYMQR